jgi:D-glycero-alpha-D-manno-heptose 1-phosphate guanylyltransferase
VIVKTDVDVLILVGGLGTRLRAAVSDRPKPMAMVGGRPFLEWLLLAIGAQGLRRIILCTGYGSDVIEEHFGSGKRLGLNILYSSEPEPLGTAGALRRALGLVESSALLVANGDTWSSVNVARDGHRILLRRCQSIPGISSRDDVA